MWSSLRFLGPLALAFTVACASSGPKSSGPFALAQDGPRKVTLHVRNLNFNQAELWAVSTNGRERLGIVGGEESSVFGLTWDFSQPLQIEIDLLAVGSCLTETLDVDPGDELDLQIDQTFTGSACGS